METPAAKMYRGDPLRDVRDKRERFVSLALTIVSAWIGAGRPKTDCRPLANFGDWRDLVCQPLMWLGQPDPAESAFVSMSEDPDQETLKRLLIAWALAFGDTPTRVRDAVTKAALDPDLSEVMREIAEQRGEINRRALGNWISRHALRPAAGLRFEKSQGKTSTERWRAVEMAGGVG